MDYFEMEKKSLEGCIITWIENIAQVDRGLHMT